MSDRSGDQPANSQVERCDACGRETVHRVTIDMIETATEQVDERNAKYGQCPGRVLVCRRCGTESRSLVNR